MLSNFKIRLDSRTDLEYMERERGETTFQKAGITGENGIIRGAKNEHTQNPMLNMNDVKRSPMQEEQKKNGDDDDKRK